MKEYVKRLSLNKSDLHCQLPFNCLITSDPHFSDKPSDAYRLGLIDWLLEQAQLNSLDCVLFLGDITQNKDNHPSRLVNALIDRLTALTMVVDKVILLKGNHDYVDSTLPFFKFLSQIPKLDFIVERRFYELNGNRLAFIPNERNFVASSIDFDNLDYVFLHQTFDGAIAENGVRMKGLDDSWMLGKKARVYSGDIHVPQILNRVTYVGAPYHIRFGDKFNPRVLMLKDGKEYDLHYPAPRKLVIDVKDLTKLSVSGITEIDQVKIRVSLTRDQFCDWRSIRTSIAEVCVLNKVDFSSIEPVMSSELNGNGNGYHVVGSDIDVLKAFCEREKLDGELLDMGELILSEDNILKEVS